MATVGRGIRGPLSRFELDDIRDMGREVGHGSYAVVKELEFHGLKCVGKKIHDILFNTATPLEQTALLEWFMGECKLLGTHALCNSSASASSKVHHCLHW